MINAPKKNLGFFPTPIHKLGNLSKYLNAPSIYIKRDDLTGLAIGGNKVRKLEFLIGDAVSKNYNVIITGGAAQSNHCRQTAGAAAACGLECHLALGGDEPELFNGNLFLDKLFGAIIHWTGKYRKGEKIPELVEELKSQGKKPYIIPYGGSNEIGAYGFIQAVDELKKQMELIHEIFTHIVFASSSGGTHTGLIIGKAKYNLPFDLVGIQVDKGEDDQPSYEEVLLNLINFSAKVTGVNIDFNEQDIILIKNYLGEGYGIMSDLDREAIRITAKYEGILLDPVYTGRAMGALIDMIRNKYFCKNDKILFWHTGGTPALFSYSDKLL